MFTGIIESLGKVLEIRKEGSNIDFLVESDLAAELKVDQSVCHDGVCLTVTAIDSKRSAHWVTAIDETLNKSNLGDWAVGSLVNLERSMLMNDRLDGHIVQGHVDLVGLVKTCKEEDGSWLFDIEYPVGGNHVTVEKGSICVSGISLTCFNSAPGKFRIAIIPYTYHHTNIQSLKPGDKVNLEFDIIGKYVQRLMNPSS